VVAGFLLIQLIPYGHNHDNPPVLSEPAWDSQQTRLLFYQACGDCHSNETVWPWYSNVAPVSWLVQRDVEEGREELNVSMWGAAYEDDDDEEAGAEAGEEMIETIVEEEMPPGPYLLQHPEARLTDTEEAALIAGIRATFGGVR
jgi:mono/diheme cytochrome c family protein